MRLSTDPARDEERSLRVLRAALEDGVTLLDTADAYAWEERERGHNERLIARALSSFEGRARVTIATKGGLVRLDGRWVHDGRARHLRAACEASLTALGVDRIDLYQLHAPDPRTPFATSMRALLRLRDEGLVREVGVCNINARQLREAQDIVPLRSVQIALSPFDDLSFRSGVPELCRELGVTLLAHSPLGGPRRAARIAKDRALRAIADKHSATPHQIVLAWLYDLGAVPLAGSTREDHAREIARAASIALEDEDRAALDARFPLGRSLRVPRDTRRPPKDAKGEVVVLMGIPGAGKSTHVSRYVEEGYLRFNRDERGGTLRGLARQLERALAGGARHAVLDNTYPTRATRHEVIEAAWSHGVPARCVWLDTSIEDAQINAVTRMLDRYGKLLDPDEITRLSRRDPGVFDPRVQYRYLRALEPPELDEGFTDVERVPFVRAPDPRLDRPAVIVTLGAFAELGDPPDPSKVRIALDRAAALRALATEAPVFAESWQPGASMATLDACYAIVRREVALPIEIATCTHPAGPPICWCRKPLPGLALALMRAHRIDPARSTWIGTSAADRAIAKNLGFRYADAAELD